MAHGFFYTVKFSNDIFKNKVLVICDDTEKTTDVLKENIIPNILKNDVAGILPNNISIRRDVEKYNKTEFPLYTITLT